MKIISIVITFLIVAVSKECSSQITFLDNPALRPLFRVIRNFVHTSNNEKSEAVVYQWNKSNKKLQKQFDASTPFFCDVNGPGRRSNHTPTSVHKLRPGDIDIIAAIGDSLTAGNGGMATNIMQVSLEYKGVSFSIGGEKTWREYLTLPNILKEFNPNLYGYSTSTGLSIHKSSKFNAAELGAMSRDTPHMTKVLIQRIKSDEHVKPQHWKLITFLIGANDFCLDICYQEKPVNIVKQHEKDLLQVLRMIRDNLPRTMVNIVLPPNIKVLLEFKGKMPECETMHHFECPCFFGLTHQKNRKLYLKVIQDWTETVIRTASRNEFNREDFTVNIQPFSRNPVFPEFPDGRTDFSYMSYDCFHFSQKGYALAAAALWNNMLQKQGQKSEGWNWKNPYHILCPTSEFPYIATRENSK